eukprot:CAMPEP_0169430646 /NCGR_PEP_ID=MMETSP1042-20121227/2512_1 /TAXON_ID=464988 /ORGANISM="Hemiselmis andersenii, Strain CCMP1180" /LENGTH=199 /DNA_ID=CAMNT_0009540979 /DNA_START=240 /DNA_END=835 /DNA_ORIENTATION=+
MTSASTSRVRLITTYAQFDSALSDSNPLVVILFTAPGCPHCSHILPAFNSISIESGMSSISFYNVNLMSGDGMGIARRNQVSGVPHFSFYGSGEFRKLLVKYKTERTFGGQGHTLGSGASEPPRAMGASRDANADRLGAAAGRQPPADKVDALIGMGFAREKAIAALQRTNNDVDLSADVLLGGGSAADKAWMEGGCLP